MHSMAMPVRRSAAVVLTCQCLNIGMFKFRPYLNFGSLNFGTIAITIDCQRLNCQSLKLYFAVQTLVAESKSFSGRRSAKVCTQL